MKTNKTLIKTALYDDRRIAKKKEMQDARLEDLNGFVPTLDIDYRANLLQRAGIPDGSLFNFVTYPLVAGLVGSTIGALVAQSYSPDEHGFLAGTLAGPILAAGVMVYGAIQDLRVAMISDKRDQRRQERLR